MMFCTKCGEKIDQQDTFCTECGQAIIALEKEVQTEQTDSDGLYYKYKAYRQMGRFWYQAIDSKVHINANLCSVEVDYHGKILKKQIETTKFRKVDVDKVKMAFVSVIYFADILRILIGMFLLVTGIYGVLALGVFIFITINRAIIITLKDGKKVKIYFENPDEVADLVTEFNYI